MSLSSLIVQREVATMRQVEEALARQVIYGADLVTNLMEVTRVDEAVLATLLGESMHCEPAPAGELPVASERVRALVPPEMALQRVVVPLAVEQETLVLAVAEALPGDVLEQLGFSLGMKITQRAAPAVRVRQAIARIYGVPLDRRMQRLVARLSGEPSSTGSMPPPLGAVPDLVAPPRPPSAPPLIRTTSRSFPAARPVEPSSAPPAAAQAALPDSSPPATPVVPERRPGLLQREIPPSMRAGRRRRGPVTFEVAKREADEAEDRDVLLDLFFDFSRQYFDYATLFLVHGDIAEGRDAFGPGATRERVVGIGVPLDLPGLLAGARDQRASVVTKAPPGGLEAQLLADLSRPRDVEIAIVPLVVRTRAVALLVGDCGESGVDRANVHHVVAFASVIGKAFERVIVRRKLAGFIAGNRTEAAGRIDPAMVSAKPGALRPSLLPPTSAPPPAANVASLRQISGPPIPREDPPDSSPRRPRVASSPPTQPQGPIARAKAASSPEITVDEPDYIKSDEAARELFDELGWDAQDDDIPPPPPSAAIAVPAHAPPSRHIESPVVPSVIVDFEHELGTLVDRVADGTADEQVEGELLRQGERAMRVIMARFPGPLTIERSRITTMPVPPRPSECGPILRLVTRERKVALPFVLERLTHPDAEVRGWATHVLCELPYTEAIDPLVLRLRDMDLGTRVSAAHALAAVGRMSPEPVRTAVLHLAHSADSIDRAAAARAMAELRDASLVPDLVRALADGDEAVESEAHQALVQVTRQDFGLDARPWLRWWELNASRHRVEWLIDSLTHEIAEVRRAAGEELRAASKEYFGYAADLPPRDRERAQQRYRDWWVTEGRARMRQRA
jgi:hypothetical protein